MNDLDTDTCGHGNARLRLTDEERVRRVQWLEMYCGKIQKASPAAVADGFLEEASGDREHSQHEGGSRASLDFGEQCVRATFVPGEQFSSADFHICEQRFKPTFVTAEQCSRRTCDGDHEGPCGL